MTKHGLKMHKFTHSGERPFRCPQCDKGFSHKYNMQRHQRIHARAANVSGTNGADSSALSVISGEDDCGGGVHVVAAGVDSLDGIEAAAEEVDLTVTDLMDDVGEEDDSSHILHSAAAAGGIF